MLGARRSTWETHFYLRDNTGALQVSYIGGSHHADDVDWPSTLDDQGVEFPPDTQAETDFETSAVHSAARCRP